MNKSKFPHDRKEQKHPSQGGNKPQWPGHDTSKNPGHHNPGQNPNKPQWPGHKDNR